MEIAGLSFEKTIILFGSFLEKYTLFPVIQSSFRIVALISVYKL